MRFLPQLEIRPSSTAPNPVEFGAAPPNCTVSLTSQRHPEKLPDVSPSNTLDQPGLNLGTMQQQKTENVSV